MTDESKRRADYRTPRIIAATILTLLVAFMVVADAVSADYEISPLVLVPVIAAILTLLGLEAADVLRTGK